MLLLALYLFFSMPLAEILSYNEIRALTSKPEAQLWKLLSIALLQMCASL